jgi:hypothetical protein
MKQFGTVEMVCNLHGVALFRQMFGFICKLEIAELIDFGLRWTNMHIFRFGFARD